YHVILAPLDLRTLSRGFGGLQNGLELFFLNRNGLVSGAHEAGHSSRGLDEIPRGIVQDHIYEDVSRIYFPLDFLTLPCPGADLNLGRDLDVEYLVAQIHRLSAAKDIRHDLVFVPGVGVDRVPVSLHSLFRLPANADRLNLSIR